MATRGCIIALLNPKDAFEHISLEIVRTDEGILQITGNKLILTFDLEDKVVEKVAEKMKTAFDLLRAFASTLAWVTELGVGYEVLVLLQFGDGALQTTFPVSDWQPQLKIDSSGLSSTEELLSLVMSDEYLEWALDDFRTALRERGDTARKRGRALIFLYRSIEWLEICFHGRSKLKKELGITKEQLDSITGLANTRFYTRHAEKDAPPVTRQELEDAFENTRQILEKYMDYLSSQAINGA